MSFTPIESGIGGLLIGLSAALAYYADGKIAGISGIFGPALRGVVTCQPIEGAQLWKLCFLIGLVLGGCVNLGLNQDFAFPAALAFSPLRYAAAGICVGMGTRAGRGCTSGHGICGLPRFSLRSWIAVPVFMGVAAATVAVTRHGAKIDPASPWAVAELQWPPKWEFPLGALGASLLLAVAAIWTPGQARSYVSPLAAGTIFGLGLGCSGMTSQAKVLNFLDVGGTWDPSLAFVMGCGLCVSFPVMFWSERPGKAPLHGQFEKPAKTGNYGSLVIGAALFGLGWGLIGVCPGPAVAGAIPYAAQGWGDGLSFGLSFLMIALAWLATDKCLRMGEAPKEAPKSMEPAQPDAAAGASEPDVEAAKEPADKAATPAEVASA
eukprot:gb/GFBE01038652.1/.p1 GENE.gb/GFBE01038652.1/~~gb/GFBE01038652.1/.p1  ORF type:complete len:378 (+),score=86.40 gb/GFBE01038652.1/:1-1134(+)